VQIKTIHTFEFDDKAEEARIKSCFGKRPEKMERHLKLLDAFREGKRQEFYQLRENLPYDEEEEYHEIENINPFMVDIMYKGDSGNVEHRNLHARLNTIKLEFST
jgi:hypothetical protein